MQPFVLACCLLLFYSNAHAQKLTELLRNENASALAIESMESGNAVRGAIIFARAELGCSTCHIQGVQDGLGPDLTNLDPTSKSPASVVQSLLDPSAVIQKGYETTKVLTADGQVYSGRLLTGSLARSATPTDEESGSEPIILRSSSGTQKRIRLKNADVEQIQTTAISLMPAGLVDQLKNRQEFLDLLKYVAELQSSREGDSETTTSMERLTYVEEGLLALDQFHCTQCHAMPDRILLHPHPTAPNLRQLSGRLSPDYLRDFLAAPHDIKPGTPMPDLLSEIPSEEKRTAVAALVQFLTDSSEQQYAPATVDVEAAQRGESLYRTIGCVACHTPSPGGGANEDNIASGDNSNGFLSLGSLAYSTTGLVEYLEAPHLVRPSGRMPQMGLSHWEAVDLANYLLSVRTSVDPTSSVQAEAEPTVMSTAELANRGKEYFSKLGCANCHQNLVPTATVATEIKPALLALDSTKGCLTQIKSPAQSQQSASSECVSYSLSDGTVEQIRAALEWLQEEPSLSTESEIRLTLHSFRCTACHRRDDFGGISDSHRDYFETTNPNLGPQGRFPPNLTGAGRKLKPKWLRQVLVEGKSIRPYMKTRMPQFGTANVEHLISALIDADAALPSPFPEFSDQEQRKQLREAGGQMVGSEGLNCIACHTFQLKPAQTMPAVDLTDMHERLQPAWFREFMLAPKSINSGTVMPNFWPGGKTTRADILDGNTETQVAAIWEWLKDGRQARKPRGLIRKPMEIAATREAVMLRRAYPGIGKRGIGVGYPSQVNIAFDAEQMRLGSIWAGKFIDPSGVWRSQGHGRVRPLSREVIRFRAGPELDDLDDPWVVDEGRPPRHQFTGYRLDERRRPTFTYRYGSLDVEDYCLDLIGASGLTKFLQRTITIKGSEKSKLAFRISPANDVRANGEGTYSIGQTLTLTIMDRPSQIVETPAGKSIVIPLVADESEPVELHLQYRFETEPN